ncbi:MAG: hypothetical protein JSU92_12370 [Deltaproteobacteria bacterium]|nr:MAG: hypothetical protein JSU92_12370 [Deltaproteobacteria bacterium]
MIKTVPIDIFTSLFLGALFALTGARPLKSTESTFRHRYFFRAVLFQLFVFVPIGIYLIYYFTAWSWMYFINPQAHSIWWSVLAICGYFLFMVLGFILAQYFIKKDQIGAARGVMVVGVLGILCFYLLPIRRLLVVGTYEEYVSGDAISIYRDLHWTVSMIVIGIYFGLPLFYIIRKNVLEGRKGLGKAVS